MIDALCADFDAQLDVTLAAVEFAKVCPAEGPDLDGLPGAAFVLALYQVVTEEPGLGDKLATLTRRWNLPAQWGPRRPRPRST